MARYPTLQPSARLTAGVAVPQSIDQAGLREAQKQSQSISQQADRIVNFAAQNLAKTSAIEGQRAGATAPGKTLSAFQDKSPRNVYERNAYTAAVQAASSRIETDARTQINQAHFDWLESKGPPEDLRARLDSIVDGYSESIGQLDPLAEQKLRDTLQLQTQSAHLDYSAKYLKFEAEKNEGLQVRLRNETETGIDVLASARWFSFDKLDTQLKNYRTSQAGLGRAPDDIERDVIELRLRASIQYVRSQFQRSDDQAAFLNKFADARPGLGLAANLDGNQHKALVNEMSSVVSGAATIRNKAATALTKDINSNFDQLADLFVPGATTLDAYARRARAINDADANAALAKLNRQVAIVTAMRSMSVEAQRRYADQLRDQRDKTEDENEDAGLAASIARSSKTLAGNDLVSYHNKVNTQKNIPSMGVAEMANPAVLQERLTQIATVADDIGVARTYLTATERDLGRQFFAGDASVDEKLTFLASFSDNGEAGKEALREILTADAGIYAVVGSIYAQGSAGNVSTARTMMQGIAARKNGLTPAFEEGAKEETVGLLITGGQHIIDGAGRGLFEQAVEALLLGASPSNEKITEEMYQNAQQKVLGGSFNSKGKHIAGGVVDAEGRTNNVQLGNFYPDYKVWLDPRTSHDDFEFLQDNRDEITYADIQAARRAAGMQHPNELPTHGNGKTIQSEDIQDTKLSATGVRNRAYLIDPGGLRYSEGYELPIHELIVVLRSRLQLEEAD